MLETDGMGDAHYNAHVHISKEPRCEQGQKRHIIGREEHRVLSNSSNPGADRAPLPLLLLPMVPKMCYEA